ncbi:MaoC family dehydratase N-terminal domain-containing protein [Saccharopolyspora sp.]|uniref:FAS1-like dehydratase domain-containing protein n=1 Tax=Saccharopolyspora sp. TaxID=33915 RepID=UPI0025E2DBF2|nr:MaoC family dehydratase N-terminal domain-containing protein [Saccharopolyspora sp.]
MLEEHLAGWSPEALTESDPMPPEPARALAAVLETPDEFGDESELPALWHWIYFLEWARHGELGPDGHPLEGHFLPPIPDRRRMFAGGRLTLSTPLVLGRPAQRKSSLDNVAVKQGRSGEMAFVTVRNEYRQDGALRLVEEQDYVYRSGESGGKSRQEHHVSPAESDAPWQEPFTGDPVRLFRFSALTANSHRIHYDAPYAREVESYPGLVVHGPLLVLLMTEMARRRTGRGVSSVDYRLKRPVFAGDPVLVTGHPDDNAADLTVLTGHDTVHAQAHVQLA